MKDCFVMKSKKQQHKQKHSTLAKEPQFKRSEGNRASIKRRIATTINEDEDIVNPTTRSSDGNDKTGLSHKIKTPPFWKRIFKRRTLQGRRERNLPPLAPISTSDWATNRVYDPYIQMNSIPSQLEKLNLNTMQSLPTKSKLPPIRPRSSSFLSDHQKSSLDNSKILPIRYTPGLCGLKNIGNTCFMNSAIQCLNSIPDLTEWVMKQEPSLSHMNIIHVYVSLVRSMWSGRHNCVTPQELKEYISQSAPIFSGYGQKDSHEFMNSLLNAIQAVDPSSFLVNLFRIHTQSETTCNWCQDVDITDDTTTFLPLPIPQLQSYDYTKVSLEELIKDFCQEDELNGEYYCQKCKKCRSARHKTIITGPLPRALIIQLKRFPFDGTNRKIDTFIQYKLEYQNLLSNNDTYELCAVSLHRGSLAGGHYTTTARNYQTNKWYLFDDSSIEEIGWNKVDKPSFAKQAYVLLYLKQND